MTTAVESAGDSVFTFCLTVNQVPTSFILSAEANFKRMEDYTGNFVWSGVQEVLARIWHCGREICDIFNESRAASANQ